jgi:hypothetical protein
MALPVSVILDLLRHSLSLSLRCQNVMSRPENHDGDWASGSLIQANIRIGEQAHTRALT